MSRAPPQATSRRGWWRSAARRHRLPGDQRGRPLAVFDDTCRQLEDIVSAIRAVRFEAEIVPVEVSERDRTRVVDADEGPRANTSLELLAGLKSAFLPGGTSVDAALE